MAGKDKREGTKGTSEDPFRVPEARSAAASQEDLQEVAVGRRDMILETNAKLSQRITNSIVGPLKEIKDSQVDLTKSIKDMLLILNEKLVPGASIVGDQVKMHGRQGFVLPNYHEIGRAHV